MNTGPAKASKPSSPPRALGDSIRVPAAPTPLQLRDRQRRSDRLARLAGFAKAGQFDKTFWMCVFFLFNSTFFFEATFELHCVDRHARHVQNDCRFGMGNGTVLLHVSPGAHTENTDP